MISGELIAKFLLGRKSQANEVYVPSLEEPGFPDSVRPVMLCCTSTSLHACPRHRKATAPRTRCVQGPRQRQDDGSSWAKPSPLRLWALGERRKGMNRLVGGQGKEVVGHTALELGSSTPLCEVQADVKSPLSMQRNDSSSPVSQAAVEIAEKSWAPPRPALPDKRTD